MGLSFKMTMDFINQAKNANKKSKNIKKAIKKHIKDK